MESTFEASAPVLLLANALPGPRTRVPAAERVYAIGDVHGRLDLFIALMDRICRDSAARKPARVRVIFLGDLIDRGPESAGVIDRCMDYGRRFPGFEVLKGNHEGLMEHALDGNLSAVTLWMRQGGDNALASWGVPREVIDQGSPADLVEAARQHIDPDVVAWIKTRPYTAQIGDYLFVHAGIRPGVPLSRQIPEDLMWIRNEFLTSDDDHAMIVVHGHSITDEGVQMHANRIGIDTGAYRSNVLTALALEGEDRWLIATGADDAECRKAREASDSRLAALFQGGDAPPVDEVVPAVRARSRMAVMALLAVLGCAAGGSALWLGRSPPQSKGTTVALGPATPPPVLVAVAPDGPASPVKQADEPAAADMPVSENVDTVTRVKAPGNAFAAQQGAVKRRAVGGPVSSPTPSREVPRGNAGAARVVADDSRFSRTAVDDAVSAGVQPDRKPAKTDATLAAAMSPPRDAAKPAKANVPDALDALRQLRRQ